MTCNTERQVRPFGWSKSLKGKIPGTDLADIVVVRVVFWRHQQQDESVRELDPVQRHHSHVEEDPKQHRKWDLTQNIPNHDG